MKCPEAEDLIQKVIPAVTNQTARLLRRPPRHPLLCPAPAPLSSLHIPTSPISPLLMESLPKWATMAKLRSAAKSAKPLTMVPTLLGDLFMNAKAINPMQTELWCRCFLYKPPLQFFISFLNIFVLSLCENFVHSIVCVIFCINYYCITNIVKSTGGKLCKKENVSRCFYKNLSCLFRLEHVYINHFLAHEVSNKIHGGTQNVYPDCIDFMRLKCVTRASKFAKDGKAASAKLWINPETVI